jgi:hypothetical protein
MPKRWLKAHKLKGVSAKPLSDPDRDGACNWVEFRQRINPRKANRLATTPPRTDVPDLALAAALVFVEDDDGGEGDDGGGGAEGEDEEGEEGEERQDDEEGEQA